MKVLDQVKEVVMSATVFGQPYEKDGLTVIPASRVMGGGGGGEAVDSDSAGGGVGVDARPAGAFVIRGEAVSWVPAIDVNRMILMGQLFAIIAVLVWGSVGRAQAKGRKS